ncbi:MAG: helix-turn-helix domain-containing protein [Geitlerinemataceae cyanobacterium]
MSARAWFKPAEAADMLEVHPSTLKRWRRTNLLKYRKHWLRKQPKGSKVARYVYHVGNINDYLLS